MSRGAKSTLGLTLGILTCRKTKLSLADRIFELIESLVSLQVSRIIVSQLCFRITFFTVSRVGPSECPKTNQAQHHLTD